MKLEKNLSNYITIAIGVTGLIVFNSQDFLALQIVSILLIVVPGFLLIPNLRNLWLNLSSTLRSKGVSNLKVRGSNRDRAFIRVVNTVKNGKVNVSIEEDGIYIRLSGNENEGEAFSEKKVKVYDYEK